MDSSTAQIRVHVITFRRLHLLKRALESLQRQSYRHWIAEVINDDPDDHEVGNYVASLKDPRITLSVPAVKRGGTGNFNYCFRPVQEPFACILEDDNWYEPDFLAHSLNALLSNSHIEMAVTNECVWKEHQNGTWENTNHTIWPLRKGSSIFEYHLADKCGKARICNSSMFWRTANAGQWKTPAGIPIDLTEHFRERIIPHPILLLHAPLVNFSETLQTYRKHHGHEWSINLTLLIASIFNQIEKAEATALAHELWTQARSTHKLLGTTLLNAALSDPKAKSLLHAATNKEKIRYWIKIVKRYPVIRMCRKMIRQQHENWSFLLNSFQKNHP